MLYYGRVDSLASNPDRFNWKWVGGTPMMGYNTSMGRMMLRRHHVIPPVVERKWAEILPQSFKLRWANIWDKERAKKKGGLM